MRRVCALCVVCLSLCYSLWCFVVVCGSLLCVGCLLCVGDGCLLFVGRCLLFVVCSLFDVWSLMFVV